MDYFVQAIPFFFLLIGIELAFGHYARKSLYTLPDAIANLSCGILQELVSVFFTVAMGAAYLLVYERFAIRHLEPNLLTWVGILVGVDFFYYWFHRASHRVALFWALHVVHHQSEEYNLTVALRQSALGGFFSWIFYLPLAWLGFSPQMFLASYSFNLLYQFWIHTRVIKTLGPAEWILNTPSHHRVHHGRNPKYLDKNYAGALIVWDRLFGTFQSEEEEPVYGIVHPLRSWNPVWANVHAWVEQARIAREGKGPWEKVLVFFMPPGWHPLMRGKEMPAVNPDLSLLKYGSMEDRPRRQVFLAIRFGVLLLVTSYFFFNAAAFSSFGRLIMAGFIVLSLLELNTEMYGTPNRI